MPPRVPATQAPCRWNDVVSLASAAMFGFDFYVLVMPNILNEAALEQLFAMLPPYDIVFLGDNDAVGIKWI